LATSQQVEAINSECSALQQAILADPGNIELQVIESDLRKEHTRLVKAEVDIRRQKAKVQWLKEGDIHSSFFHASLKARRQHSQIVSVCDSQGRRLTDSMEMKEEILSFYKNLLGTSNEVESIDPSVLSLGPRLTEEHKRILLLF